MWKHGKLTTKKQTIAAVVIAALILGTVAVGSYAKGGRHGFGGHHGGFGQRFETMMEHMAGRLDLSKAQRDQVFAALRSLKTSGRLFSCLGLRCLLHARFRKR